MIDPKKQYKTRDGREVRIYATDGRKDSEVHGAVKNECGWHHAVWDINGSAFGTPTCADLIEVRPRIQREVWVNVYPDDSLIIFDDKQHADEYGPAYPNQSRIACVKLVIDCEEGEGL